MTSPPHEDLESVEPSPVAADPPTHPTTPRRRSAVALLAGALVVGLISGVGGAAAYARLYGDRTAKVGSAHGQRALDSVDAVAEKVLPSVVKIYATEPDGTGEIGSGLILTSDGTVVTNHHVVARADTAQVTFTVRLADGTPLAATLIGSDPETDLALLHVEGVSDLTPITPGDSERARVGQEVVAVGAPFGLDSTVTEGIVSATHRTFLQRLYKKKSGEAVYDTIQTDASNNPGSSGGALVDLAGRVIGVTSFGERPASWTDDSAYPRLNTGINYVIPINEAMPIIDQLRRGLTPTHARLGVTGRDDAYGIDVTDGAQLTDVSSGSAAERAGLQVADVVTKLGDIQVNTWANLLSAVCAFRPGETTTITFDHGGQSRTAKLTFDSDAGQVDPDAG